MNPTVVIRQTANPHVREYHSSDPITKVPYSQVLDTELYEETPEGLGTRAMTWLKALNGNEDIAKLTFRPQSIKVTKNDGVSWRDLEPTIEQAFAEVFGNPQFIHHTKATRERVLA